MTAMKIDIISKSFVQLLTLFELDIKFRIEFRGRKRIEFVKG